jgi:hypothetical protein
VAYLLLGRVRRRHPVRRSGRYQARRFASRSARFLGTLPVERHLHWMSTEPPGSGWAVHTSVSPEIVRPAAEHIVARLTTYLQLGIGRPPGALTPAEAREDVAHLTDSEELAEQAGQLIARCDAILYGGAPAGPHHDACALLLEARRLFAALGRVPIARPRRPESASLYP